MAFYRAVCVGGAYDGQMIVSQMSRYDYYKHTPLVDAWLDAPVAAKVDAEKHSYHFEQLAPHISVWRHHDMTLDDVLARLVETYMQRGK